MNRNRYLIKIAEKGLAPVEQAKLDLMHTGVIAGLGTLGNIATHKIMNPGSSMHSGVKAGLIGGTIGLVADYAAVKINNMLSKKLGEK